MPTLEGREGDHSMKHLFTEPQMRRRCVPEGQFAPWSNPTNKPCDDPVVYTKAPFAGAANVLAYLGRYTHKTAIANHRLVDYDAEQVRFRWRDYAHGNLAQGDAPRRRRVHPTLPPARALARLHPAASLRLARQSRARSQARLVSCSHSPPPNLVSRKRHKP